ncbi:MAG: uroporphyrinogen decarboxylase family protein [Desulforhopalus sp.]
MMEDMTSLERIAAAHRGNPQPRPPYTFTLSLYGAKLIECPLTEYYRNPQCYAEGQDAVVDLCSPDILFSPFAAGLEAEAFGSELKFFSNYPPNVRKPAVHSADEFLNLSMPDVDSDPSLCYLRESVRYLAKKSNIQTPVCGVLTTPVDLPAIIMGIDMWIETLVFAPEKAAAIIDKTKEHFVRMANALLTDGAAFISVPTMFANPQILYQKLIDTLIIPALTDAFHHVDGAIVFHHGGNPIVPYLEGYLSLPKVAGFVVDHRDSLDEARKILGEKRLLLGNICGPTLSRKSMEQILIDVETILDNRKDDPYFIFSTSGADVPWDTPPELLQAISHKICAFRQKA